MYGNNQNLKPVSVEAGDKRWKNYCDNKDIMQDSDRKKDSHLKKY